MNKKALDSSGRQAVQLLISGWLLTLFFGFILLILKGFYVFLAFFIGALASVLPNMYQVLSLFKEAHPSAAKRTIKRLYKAELIKFLFVALLFIGLVQWADFNVMFFVIGFLLTQVGMWLVLPIFLSLKR